MFDYEKCVPSEFYDDELPAQLFDFIEQYKIYDGREHTCFFTGHRNMPKNLTPEILRRLKATVTYLCTKGVTDFHAGGALGFGTLAAMQIIDIRRAHPGVRLILDLPYKNQSVKWNANQQRIYDFILSLTRSTSTITFFPEFLSKTFKSQLKFASFTFSITS